MLAPLRFVVLLPDCLDLFFVEENLVVFAQNISSKPINLTLVIVVFLCKLQYFICHLASLLIELLG
jgi:hypothetical protein